MATIGIAGAGLAGRLFAWALARGGHDVQVFDACAGPEPSFDGHGAAAFSAAGMLSPLAEQEQGGAAIAALGWTSLRLWPRILASLPDEVTLRCEGSLLLAHAPDLGIAQRLLARMPGAEALDGAALQRLEPALAPRLRGWWLAGEGLIDPVAAMRALHAAAGGSGALAANPGAGGTAGRRVVDRDGAGAPALRPAPVTWHWHQPVDQVLPRELVFANGQRWRGDWAIDTRGLGARPPLPLRGVRGEIITLELAGHALRRPVRLLHPRYRVYVVPRSADTLIAGASEIESEDRSPVSVRSAVELMAAAQSVLPALSEARIVRLDRQLRPALPDNLPVAHLEAGLLRLNGLYRHGWLLAPALVEQLLVGSGLASFDDLREAPHLASTLDGIGVGPPGSEPALAGADHGATDLPGSSAQAGPQFTFSSSLA